MERLSTGKRINSAADDAAGVAITSRLTSNLKGINQSIRNAMDAQALIDTAEGGLQETEALLQRIRELAVQAASDTNSRTDRAALDAEKTQILAEIDRIASTTSWAGQNLLDGTFTSKSFQVGGGTMAADQIAASISSSTSIELGLIQYSRHGTVAIPSYPGQNNSNDVSIIANHANSSVPYFVQIYNQDTSPGMLKPYTPGSPYGGGVDSTLDPFTKVEILGIEYKINPGTQSERHSSLINQLKADGINALLVSVAPLGNEYKLIELPYLITSQR